MKRRTRQTGFTLVELLVVIAIIGIISGMAVLLVSGATDKAAATTSMAIQKQLTSQVNAYMQLHSGLLPDYFDSMIRADYATAGGTYTTLGSGSSSIPIASDPSLFMGCPPSSDANGTANINRGVDPAAFSGQNRTLTVKQVTTNDVTCLNQLGITVLCDYRTNMLSYGRLDVTNRTLAYGGAICIVDPQSVAGQQLYNDFGVDLSDTTKYPRNGSSTGTLAWDDSNELTAAGRLAALQRQIFLVAALGTSSRMIGDRQVGLQEAPASSVVSGGYYNRFALVIKFAGLSAVGSANSDRSASFVGVLDPKGRGASAARQAVSAIQ